MVFQKQQQEKIDAYRKEALTHFTTVFWGLVLSNPAMPLFRLACVSLEIRFVCRIANSKYFDASPSGLTRLKQRRFYQNNKHAVAAARLDF